MRRVAVAFLILTATIGFFWWFYLDSPGRFAEMVPEDVMALMILSRTPSSLEELRDTELLKWIELDIDQIQERFGGERIQEIFLQLDQHLETGWVALHGIQQKESGSVRLQLTAFLVPRTLQIKGLREWLSKWVLEQFGEQAVVLEEGPVKIFRGKEPGQLLYLVQVADFLVLSNSEAGWRSTFETAQGERPSLASDPGFQEIIREVGLEADLFLYLKATGLLGLLPPTGYGLWFNEGRVVEKYHQIGLRD